MVSIQSLKHPLVYVGVSFAVLFLYILDYVNTYRELYPTVIAITSSAVFNLLVANTTVAFFVGFWYIAKMVFFGKLTPAEKNAVAPAFPVYLAECIGIPLYLEQNMYSWRTFFMVFTVVVRVLHKLAEERITTTSALPNGTARTFQVIRVFLFIVCSHILDLSMIIFVMYKPEATDATGAMYWYCVLLLYCQFLLVSSRNAIKLVYQQFAQDRDNRTPLVFYSEKTLEIIHSGVFVVMFVFAQFSVGQIPFVLLRNFFGHVYLISENFLNVSRYYFLARRVSRLPNATEEDLTGDISCTICYDELKLEEAPKVLPCGHIYHRNCLGRWFEGHATCPYCRADVLKAKAPAKPHRPAPTTAPAPQPEPPHEREPENLEQPRFTQDELINAYQSYLNFLEVQGQTEAARDAPEPSREEPAVTSDTPASEPQEPQRSTEAPRRLASERLQGRKLLEKACQDYVREVERAQQRFLEEVEKLKELAE